MTLEKYTGHKKHGGLYHKIINQIPRISFNYSELFAGSATIYSLIDTKDLFVLLNDIDAEVKRLLSKKFPELQIESKNAIHLLKNWRDVPGEFIFLDSPYHHSTRPNATNLYKNEMTHDDHVQLLNAVQDLESNIMIIHPKCDLYDSMISSWRKIPLKVRYHQKNES